eukprot:gnl/Spiro4/8347_TR4386_c0_g1_i1.p1 gnl/Spiro4/8347_TR4386_c0_g1~~gnl/Spiro4/8347_TR4386_c0_g1_i1.p1  ORF type:complete len:768 (-),score=186.71 gnl/Spiro4/8347_TR4386_c0_g1_i1:55-2358(-)
MSCQCQRSVALVFRGASLQKEECCLCFQTQDDDEGINLCLECHFCGCREHLTTHSTRTGHCLSLNIRRSVVVRPEEAPREITRVAIGLPGGASSLAAEYTYASQCFCVKCGNIDLSTRSEQTNLAVLSVMEATSQSQADQVKAWEDEVKPCSHTSGDLPPITTPLPQLAGKALDRCTACELTDNLWLCLTCGALGCGRQQMGGLPGHGHALAHYTATRHPVSVKLGSITPDSADLHCYACDKEVVMAKLGEALARFGININTQEVHGKTIKELDLALNLALNLAATSADGVPLAPAYGPGITGINNIGNSCYLASVLQCVFSLPSFVALYSNCDHQNACRDSRPHMCFGCQLNKMVLGLNSGKYSRPPRSVGTAEPLQGQEGVSPRMFRAIVGRNHDDFSTFQQQDCLQYFEHLLSMITQFERPNGRRPADLFAFRVQQRLQCTGCSRVRYSSVTQSSLLLPLLDESQTLESCLRAFASDECVELACPQCNSRSATFLKHFRLETTPGMLVLCINRFRQVGTNYVFTKNETQLRVPDVLDVSDLLAPASPAPGEQLLPTEAVPPGPVADPAVVREMQEMLGFPELHCRKAALACNNQMQQAVEWLLERAGDPDLDAPLPAPASKTGASFSPEVVAAVVDMGFSPEQAKLALSECDGSGDRAVLWLFSHVDELDSLVAAASSSGPAPMDTILSTTSAPSPAPRQQTRPTFRLRSFITHKGTSIHCGHYIAHVRQPNGQWIRFDDNRVVVDPNPPVGGAYMFFYESVPE